MESTHKIVSIEGARNKYNERMWRCLTEDGEKVNVFTSTDPAKDQLFEWTEAGYDLPGIVDGQRETWRLHPIAVTMQKKGDWWTVTAVADRPEGSEADPVWQPNPTLARVYAMEWAQLLIKKPVIVLDTETTGTQPDDEIISVGVVATSEIVEDQTYYMLVKPDHLERVAVSTPIHGITAEMLADKPTFDRVYDMFLRTLSGNLWAIYNAPFDVRMLYRSCLRYGLSPLVSAGVHDIMDMVAHFRGEWDPVHQRWTACTLVEACEMFDVELDEAHNSLSDARATLEVYRRIAGL